MTRPVQPCRRAARRGSFLTLLALLPLLAAPAGAEKTPDDRRKIVTLENSATGLPYSPAVWAGDFLMLSGALGTVAGTPGVPGDAVAQTRQAMKNLQAVLAAADLDLSRVVSSDLYLSDRADFTAITRAYAAALPEGGVKPTRASLETDLALPDARIEIGMIAARKGLALEKIQPPEWRESSQLSWGVKAGSSLFISGMLAIDPKTGSFENGDAAAQTTFAMNNVGAVLKAAGMGFEDLARCRVFLADARDYGAMNEAYGAFFKGIVPPARATVRAKLLPSGARLEVQCVAVKPGKGEAARAVRSAAGSQPSGRPFSPSIEVGGTLYLAGMVGRGKDGYPAGLEAQARVTLERLEATLKAAGLTFRDVASAVVYLTDIRHYDAMNAVYKEVLGDAAPPARATVGTALMSPDALIEIQMTAISKP